MILAVILWHFLLLMKHFSHSRCRTFRHRICLLAFVAVAALSGCTYKSEIRQGNDELPRHLEDLKVGMTEQEVTDLLGSSRVPRVFEDDSVIYYFRRRTPGFLPSIESVGVKLTFTDGKLTVIDRLTTDQK